MATPNKTSKVTFCCPHHGALQGNVEYLTKDIGTRTLIDLPVVYCRDCNKYYTPFSNLLALTKLEHKGQQIKASQSHVEKAFPRAEVRVPRFKSKESDNHKSAEAANNCQESRAQQRKERLLKIEKNKEYIEHLRYVEHNSVILSNKPIFLSENKCPICRNGVKKENIKLRYYNGRYVLTSVKRCNLCNSDYITPNQFYAIRKKALKLFDIAPFVYPVNIYAEHIGDDKYLFLLHDVYNKDIYDLKHLPPRADKYYDMSDEEYNWVKSVYEPEEYIQNLRPKSFLGEAGYSTNESEKRRQVILQKCVSEYGKSKVIHQIKSNMNNCLRQKNGSVRYQRALNIWRHDINYITNHL